MLRRLTPEVLVTHPRNDMHADHRRTADVALAAVPLAVIETGHPQRVYACDTYESLTSTDRSAARSSLRSNASSRPSALPAAGRGAGGVDGPELLSEVVGCCQVAVCGLQRGQDLARLLKVRLNVRTVDAERLGGQS